MANVLLDNTYVITDSQTTALTWPGNAIINTVVFSAIDTTGRAEFYISAATPILKFSVLTQGAGTSVMSATESVDMGRTRFPTAWIPSIMTACTAWIHFA